MRRAFRTAAMLIGVLGASASSALAQRAAPCTYDECALRLRSSFWSTSLVQGIDAERVARMGFFAPQVPLFQQRSDSAAAYYAAFRSRYNTGAALSLVGLGAAIVAAVAASSETDLAVGMIVVSIPLTFAAGVVRSSAAERLSRAVWWHNRELAR